MATPVSDYYDLDAILAEQQVRARSQSTCLKTSLSDR